MCSQVAGAAAVVLGATVDVLGAMVDVLKARGNNDTACDSIRLAS